MRVRRSTALLLVVFVSGCSRGAPPSWDASVDDLARVSLAAPLLAIDDAGPAGEISDGDAGALPQTRERPRESSTELDGRAKALLAAIKDDDPARAMPFFFPLAAYAQVKDIPRPERDWKRRLVANYERDIHELHNKTQGLDTASHTRLEIQDARARWVEPGEESNKIGYYRVFGTKLHFSDGRR